MAMAMLAVPFITRAETEPRTQPTPDTEAVDAETVLMRLTDQVSAIDTLTAQLRYDRIQQIVGDTQRRFGTLMYERSAPRDRFALRFRHLLVDGTLRDHKRSYISNGDLLVERRPSQKRLIKRRLETPIGLSSGQLPLPFITKPDCLRAQYHIEVEHSADDHHLTLTPREDNATDFTRIVLWYNPQTYLPSRIRTVDRSQNISVVQLSDVTLDQKLPDGAFDMSAPAKDWRILRPNIKKGEESD